ncbi:MULTISPECIES: hypothetical protein [unclassified Sphingomonas]|uniref:hypothetical protein n=1 Tax=unclassified Sphingomonas TaxID=196159 RepID=UPI0006F674E9|nr:MULTISPECIES: hypothetical protein [unclassified Sphingomonas]KQX24826.1 hypothetical protein ASD17_24210 [Sphingomonas sp. Root1294]KQY69814.1 hypothetical protein ASD39_24325 [Sphingomonas sp. Root50]KRB93928.1 hypothetical protein ASE22_24715 [Sphingomonas sp. Root720]
MSSESRDFHADSVQVGGVERTMVSGEEIRRRVQAMIDEDPELASCDKPVLAPMPKPTARESPTGCNWTMHYLGQFPGCEPAIDRIVALVQNDVNIGSPTRP